MEDLGLDAMDQVPEYLLAVACLAVIGLLITPALIQWFRGRMAVRSQMLGYFQNPAMVWCYFKFFPNLICTVDKFPGTAAERDEPWTTNLRTSFAKLYDDQFGKGRFWIAFVLYAALASAITIWVFLSIANSLGLLSVGKSLPPIPLYAAAGGLSWVVTDQIKKAYSRAMLPADLMWGCFRLAISVPMGYALSAVFPVGSQAAAAFLLGSFPTTTLLSIGRRIGAKNLNLGDSATGDENELLGKIQGIDRDKAERFGDEGVTTIMELAYSDPVLLSIRTNFDFAFTLDCISQALLWIYLEEKTAAVRKFTFRGAQEVSAILEDLQSTSAAGASEADKARAQRINDLINQASVTLGYKSDAEFREVLIQVDTDPYTQFICGLWFEVWGRNVKEALDAAEKM